jgi:hypothetical protein
MVCRSIVVTLVRSGGPSKPCRLNSRTRHGSQNCEGLIRTGDDRQFGIRVTTNQGSTLQELWPNSERKAGEDLDSWEHYGAFQRGQRRNPPCRDTQTFDTDPLNPVSVIRIIEASGVEQTLNLPISQRAEWKEIMTRELGKEVKSWVETDWDNVLTYQERSSHK